MDDVIVTANNISKYMHEVYMHFNIREITDSPNYYLGNELVRVLNIIHVSSTKYVNEIMRNYKNIHGDSKKELLTMKVKEHPDMYEYPSLDENDHKEF